MRNRQSRRYSRRTVIRAAGTAALGTTVLSTSSSAHSARDAGDILEGQVSLVAEESNGHPTRLGIELDEAALTNNVEGNDEPLAEVGDRAELVVPDSFPGNFEHIGAWWNPNGHPPPEVYTVPHFDVHCYTITTDEKHQIQGSPLFGGTDVPQPLPPDQLPPNHVPDHSVVPEMGLHWFDTTAPEFRGEAFTHTNIYGSYQGDLIFVEPMVTKDFLAGLADGETVETPIATPDRYPEAGFYPTKYDISYDESESVYRILLTGFESFEATQSPL